MDLLNNLQIVRDVKRLPSVIDGRGVHATNGTYAYDAAKIVPTMLAGFQYVADVENSAKKQSALAAKNENDAGRMEPNPSSVFLIGVNSNHSMQAIMTKKGASTEDINAMESHIVRAMKVAMPLALEHPERNIIVAFYDEETPNALYGFLAEKNVDLRSLHKHGYGTEPNAPKIEGSEHFGMTLGFPLPNDEKPVCFDLTPRENQPHVNVRKLTDITASHGKPYLSVAGKLLATNHDENYIYTQDYTDAERGAPSAAATASVPKPQQP